MTDLLRLLLVDDNQDDYEATLRSLKKNHCLNPVKWCKGGQDALDFLQKKGAYAQDNSVERPDLILLDLNMPGMDGKQVLEKIKGDTAFKNIPVIVLTTSADNIDVERCYSLGASTYIQKPVSFDGLTAAVRTMKNYWCGIALLPSKREE
jgi:two-component system response regulator